MANDTWLERYLEDMKQDIADVSKEVKLFNGNAEKIAKKINQEHENRCEGLRKIPEMSEKVNAINDFVEKQKAKEHHWNVPKPTKKNITKLGGAGAIIGLITALVNYFKGGG